MDTSSLAHHARRAEARLRLSRALRAFSLWLPLPLAYAAIALAVVKAAALPSAAARPWLWATALPALVVLFVVARAARRRSPREGSLALDRHHGLNDRVTNALSFASVPEPKRTPLMRAAIADAVARAPGLSPRAAAPVRFPAELGWSAAIALALLGLSLLEVRQYRVLPPRAPSVAPMLLGADDVELFREIGAELAQRSDDPETQAAARKFNQLVEDVAAHRLDRREVFERLSAMERELSDSSALEREATEEGLKAVARELEKSGLTKDAAQALAEQRLEDAEKAMRELAERLKRKQDAPTKQQLEQLRKAVEKASQATTERKQAIEARRQELEEEQRSLLKKKQAGDTSAKNEQKLADNQRRLERLDREKQRAERAQQKMSELDKQLQQAARDLMQEAGLAAKDFENAAEDLNRMSKQQLSDEQKKEMLRRLQELREVLRQQGKGGKEQQERLRRFGERARGGQGQGQRQAGGQGKPGQQSGPPELKLSRGSGEGPGIDVPMPGSGPSAASPDGQGKDGDQAGKNYGSGHDPNLAGDATQLDGKTQDVSAAGVDSGQGAASAEVIYGAAERGFTSRGYQKVFTDYETVAEQVLEQDEIPPGYRFYVRRYFQLIRPRD